MRSLAYALLGAVFVMMALGEMVTNDFRLTDRTLLLFAVGVMWLSRADIEDIKRKINA